MRQVLSSAARAAGPLGATPAAIITAVFGRRRAVAQDSQMSAVLRNALRNALCGAREGLVRTRRYTGSTSAGDAGRERPRNTRYNARSGHTRSVPPCRRSGQPNVRGVAGNRRRAHRSAAVCTDQGRCPGSDWLGPLATPYVLSSGLCRRRGPSRLRFKTGLRLFSLWLCDRALCAAEGLREASSCITTIVVIDEIPSNPVVSGMAAPRPRRRPSVRAIALRRRFCPWRATD